MKLTLHHVSFSSENVSRLDAFYNDILQLPAVSEDIPKQEKNKGYAGQLAFRTDGAVQTHIAQKDLSIGFKTGHAVNPVERGHIAYRTDDIEAFKAHLEVKGVQYSDFGHTAAKEWHQIFFYDPDGNIIEVHQVDA
ncbi:MAG: glyoxylase I family protein [Ascidiaceihabitans sp.]|jgi:glyoxylase I family protein